MSIRITSAEETQDIAEPIENNTLPLFDAETMADVTNKQTLDIVAVTSKIGDLMIENGIKGGFQITVNLLDVPFMAKEPDTDAPIPAYECTFEWAAEKVIAAQTALRKQAAERKHQAENGRVQVATSSDLANFAHLSPHS